MVAHSVQLRQSTSLKNLIFSTLAILRDGTRSFVISFGGDFQMNFCFLQQVGERQKRFL